jgi:hypothetical protein
MHPATASSHHSGHNFVADQRAHQTLMYAAHFAAGLAIKGYAPKAPTWALMSAVFVPDVVWIGLAALGIEPADSGAFFDDWSHSLASILVQAALLAGLYFFWRRDPLWLPVGIAVLTHFFLDLPIHPAPLALYPHSSMHFDLIRWDWASAKSFLGQSHYWWIQLMVVIPLLALYIRGASRAGVAPNLMAASVICVFGLHLLL